MKRWIGYIREQFPIKMHLVLLIGIVLSGVFLGQGSFHLASFLLSLLGIAMAFIALQLNNDVSSIEKDRILHKTSPLVRGSITKKDATLLIRRLQMIMFIYSLFLWVALQGVAALAYACVTCYVWILNQDFSGKHFLNRYRFLKGLFQQGVIIPIAIFAVAAPQPDAVRSPDAWWFAIMLLGAFYCYDLCRTLNPQAHPVLATYIHFYGFRRTYEIAILTLTLAVAGAAMLQLSFLLLPWEIILLAALSVLFVQTSMFRFAEAAVTISLLAHVWGVVLGRLLA